jgi:hypothetical protein
MDGAFGGLPDMESHAAYVFCGVGTLAILESLDELDKVSFLKRMLWENGSRNDKPCPVDLMAVQISFQMCVIPGGFSPP